MGEFLTFWWNCVKSGSTGSFAIFGFVETLSAIVWGTISALKLFKRQRKPWEAKVKKAAVCLFAGSFLLATIFVAPFVQYKDTQRSKTAANIETASWSNKWTAFQQKADEAKQNKLNRSIEDVQRQARVDIQNASADIKRMLLAVADTNQPFRQALNVIAQAPQSAPTNQQPFDLQTSLAELDSKLIQKEAKARLAEIVGKEQSMIQVSNCYPTFSYILSSFKDLVTAEASTKGDKVLLAGNLDPPYMLAGHGQWTNVDLIRLATNTAWSFWAYLADENTLKIASRHTAGHFTLDHGMLNLELYDVKGRVLGETYPSPNYEPHIRDFLGMLMALHHKSCPMTNVWRK